MNAWINSARPTAIATVSTSSMIDLTADLGAFSVERAISKPQDCLQKAEPARGPVSQDRAPDDPLARDRAPIAAVLGVRTIVAHHVVLARRNLDRGRQVARAGAAAGDGVRVVLAHAVADHVPVDDADAVAREPNQTLDERL